MQCRSERANSDPLLFIQRTEARRAKRFPNETSCSISKVFNPKGMPGKSGLPTYKSRAFVKENDESVNIQLDSISEKVFVWHFVNALRKICYTPSLVLNYFSLIILLYYSHI